MSETVGDILNFGPRDLLGQSLFDILHPKVPNYYTGTRTIPYSVLLGQSLFDIRYPKIITTGTVSTSTGSPGAGYFWPELVKRDRLRLRPQLLQLLSIAFLNFKILIFLGSKNKF